MDENANGIDIVFPWVDGSDPAWRLEKKKYSGITEGDDREIRYRDWGLLKYLFRGIEKNLPWVRKAHFITWGHLPSWINTECERLHIVKHADFIPERWLPTFNANPIELNIHRIQGLSDKLVYMNDDTYFIKPMKPEDFFIHGLPVSQAGLGIITDLDRVFMGILNTDLEAINWEFSSREVFRKQFTKFVNIRYSPSDNMKTLLLAPWCRSVFPGFTYIHGPNAYLKSTLEEVWKRKEWELSETCSHRFRTFFDYSQGIFLWWQWCSGSFVPRGIRKQLKLANTGMDTDKLKAMIQNAKSAMLCINDTPGTDYDIKQQALVEAFESILGEKSSFEI